MKNTVQPYRPVELMRDEKITDFEFEDFIGVWKNFVPKSFCQELIDFFDVNSIKQSHSSGSQANVYLLDMSSLVMKSIVQDPTDIYKLFQGFFYDPRMIKVTPARLRALSTNLFGDPYGT